MGMWQYDGADNRRDLRPSDPPETEQSEPSVRQRLLVLEDAASRPSYRFRPKAAGCLVLRRGQISKLRRVCRKERGIQELIDICTH